MKRMFLYGLCLYFGLVSFANARDIHLYSNDFDNGDLVGWTTEVTNSRWQRPVAIATTPDGFQRFLGEFGNQAVRLTLRDLPPHDSLTVSFDLFILRSWDGNVDPDLWMFSVDDSLLLRTTFSNVSYPQAFPGTWPNTRADARMGAVANNSLGFTWSEANVYDGPLDSYYRLSFTFPHSASTATLSFEAQLKDSRPVMSNESWGLDNVVVQGAYTPRTSQPRMTGDNAGTPQQEEAGTIPSYDLSDVAITLQRGACFGHCPIYTVTVHGDGRVEFLGEKFVQAVGPHTDSIPVRDVNRLVHAFYTSGFFAMQDEYTNPHVTDLPTVRTTFSGSDGTKSIRDYFGAPEALRKLEKLIDEIARTDQWIKDEQR